MFDSKYENWSVDLSSGSLNVGGILTLQLDVPGHGLNVLNASVMTELQQIVSEIESVLEHKSAALTLVVIKSGKESGFLAGADVNVIAAIETVEEADRLIVQGQELFHRIEQLSVTTLAVIHGPCMGGGLELSLACNHRIARDNSSTKLGLPEIKLGLIPGWGGTQRLPRLIGISESLKMILTGKPVSAVKALHIGLVDRAIKPDDWRDEVAKFENDLVTGDAESKVFGGSSTWTQAWHWMESTRLGREFVLRQTRQMIVAKQLAIHYPAVNAAVRAVAAAWGNETLGYETERAEFCDLVTTPTSRQLLRLFFSRQSAREHATWCPASLATIHRTPIRKLGVVGGGAMGAGIAFAAATRGYHVAIKEIDAEKVSACTQRLDDTVSIYCDKKRMPTEEANRLRGLVEVSDEWCDLSDCDLIVEAVVERMDVKQSVLSSSERIASGHAILATNTSSLSVDEMAASLRRPSRFAGLHFFNPVHRMELVEVVRGKQTSDSTISQLVALVRAMGKTPVVTKDTPGFCVNRILFPYLGEAVLMVDEGYCPKDLDRQIRDFGMPMGPVELLDHVGLDVAFHVADTLRHVLQDADRVTDVLGRMVGAGRMGKKAKRGFYDYHDGKPFVSAITDRVDAMAPRATQSDFREDGLTSIQRRLVYPLLMEASRCREEGVVEFDWAIDLAMVLGTGFAPHLGGPLELIQTMGQATFQHNLKLLKQQDQPPRVSV